MGRSDEPVPSTNIDARRDDEGQLASRRPRYQLGAPILIVAVAVSVAAGSALAVRLFVDLGPVGTLWLRSLLAALILIPIARRSFRWPLRDQAKRLLALGLSLGVCNLTFYESLSRIPLGVATTVEFIGPLTVAVVGSRRARDLLWAGLAAAGVALLGYPTTHVDPIGFTFALAAAASWAAYILLSKRLVHEIGPVLTVTTALVVSSLLLSPFGIASAGGSLFDPSVIAMGLAVAILSAGLPYLLEMIALRMVPASTFGVLLSLEPATAALMGLAILGQKLAVVQLVSILLVVIASAGANRGASRRLGGTSDATLS